jgi:enoyl-CoA hydratase
MSNMPGIIRLDYEEFGDAGRVATITLDRPSKLNTLTLPLLADLKMAAQECHEDETLRAVVFRTAGERAFAGGADITMQVKFTPVDARHFITRLHETIQALRNIPVPVIARIQGFCLGWGPELAAACDLRVAAENAVFGMPEVKVGVPSIIEAALMPRFIGWGRAAEMLLLGNNITAQRAYEIGMVDRVIETAKLDDAVKEWVNTIVENAPKATRLQKALMRRWECLPLDEAVMAGIEYYARAFESEEPAKRMQAFIDRPRSARVA